MPSVTFFYRFCAGLATCGIQKPIDTARAKQKSWQLLATACCRGWLVRDTRCRISSLSRSPKSQQRPRRARSGKRRRRARLSLLGAHMASHSKAIEYPVKALSRPRRMRLRRLRTRPPRPWSLLPRREPSLQTADCSIWMCPRGFLCIPRKEEKEESQEPGRRSCAR